MNSVIFRLFQYPIVLMPTNARRGQINGNATPALVCRTEITGIFFEKTENHGIFANKGRLINSDIFRHRKESESRKAAGIQLFNDIFRHLLIGGFKNSDLLRSSDG